MQKKYPWETKVVGHSVFMQSLLIDKHQKMVNDKQIVAIGYKVKV
jgi:hypothetical protein